MFPARRLVKWAKLIHLRIENVFGIKQCQELNSYSKIWQSPSQKHMRIFATNYANFHEEGKRNSRSIIWQIIYINSNANILDRGSDKNQ